MEELKNILEKHKPVLEQLRPALRMEKVWQVNYEDKPEKSYYIELSGGEFKVEKGQHSNPNAQFITSYKNWSKIIGGELDMALAFMIGELGVEGPMETCLADTLIFRYLLQQLSTLKNS